MIIMVNENDLTDEQKAVLFIISKLTDRFAVDNLYIQKAVFLISKILPDSVAIYDYEPHNFGMFSPEVESIIKREQDLSLMNDLKITDIGKEIIKKISNTENIRKIDQIFSDIEGLGREDVLYLLYKLYPEYTVNSTIKERVDSYRLQSAVIPTNELKEGQEMVIKTDKGNFIRVKRSGNTIKILEYGESNYGQN